MASDIAERTAGLNTQMRFGNYRAALSLAYRLRLDLQLLQPTSSKVQQELESVESVIENLERLKISKWQRWAKRFWESIVESFHPPEPQPVEEAPAGAVEPAPPVEPEPVPEAPAARPNNIGLGGDAF